MKLLKLFVVCKQNSKIPNDKISVVAKEIKILLLGVKGKAMQSYADQLTDAEIAAVITYERNSWGNADKEKYGEHAGGTVTPEMVKAMRTKLGLK